jgi:hypothetical protein
MIKSNELRVGSTVLYIERIVTIKNAVELYNAIDRSTNILYEPIPLTHEILKKCGFEKYEPMMYRLKSGWHWIALDINSIYINGRQSVLVNYLHQLQNLYFALTGEELTVNL